MNVRNLLGAVAIAMVAAFGVGCEDDDVDGDFVALDYDGDGGIEVAEWSTAFGNWDLNDDAYLTANEYLLDDGFDDLDLNDDGLLTADEFAAGFGLWDVDDDGILEDEELF
jgi:hypothetical protein